LAVSTFHVLQEYAVALVRVTEGTSIFKEAHRKPSRVIDTKCHRAIQIAISSAPYHTAMVALMLPVPAVNVSDHHYLNG